MANKAEDARNYLVRLIENAREENPELLKEEKDFRIFSFLCNRYFYNLEADDAYSCIVDGPNDCSVDSICAGLDEEDNSIDFIQTKWRTTFDLTTAKGEICEMEATANNLRRMKYNSIREEVREKFDDLRGDYEPSSLVFHYVYFTSATPTEKQKAKAKEQLIGDRDDIDIYFGDEIQDYIECEIQKTSRVSDGQLVIDKTNNVLKYGEDAIIVNISALSLKALYGKYRRALFGLNLRYYVKNKTVDKGLGETISKHSEKFWYLNNGLVIVCEDFNIDGTVVKFKKFSIVNGGQTTDRIYNTNFDNDFYISCKIIRVPENSGDGGVVTSQDIAIATNSQKPIRDKDIVANRPEQLKMVEEFRKCKPPIQYITKNGERIEKQYKDKNQHITLDKLGKLALASVLQMPWTRSGFNNLYKPDSPWYNKVYKGQIKNLQVYADLIRIDNYYKAFINKKVQTTNPKLTRNGRTFAIAAVTFASLFMQKGVNTDVQKIEESEDRQNSLVAEIATLNKIIVNNLDNEEQLFTDFFICLSDDVLVWQYELENERTEGGLDESNFLKKKEPYLMALRRIYSKLSNPGNPINDVAVKIFKPVE